MEKGISYMRIEELTPGQTLTLMIVAGSQQLDFTSSVLEAIPRRHMIIASPVLKDGKIISFSGPNIIVHVIASMGDAKPHVFQNVTIQSAKNTDDTFCYMISTNNESKEFNRRGAFRCSVGAEAPMRIGNNHRAITGVIKDVSSTGFAFTAPDDMSFDLSDTIHAVLNDSLSEGLQPYTFHLFGTIVRTYSLENGKIVYGCQLNNKVPGLDHYIMEKERLRLQRSRGNSKTPTKK